MLTSFQFFDTLNNKHYIKYSIKYRSPCYLFFILCNFKLKLKLFLVEEILVVNELNKFWITGLPQFPKRDFVISCGWFALSKTSVYLDNKFVWIREWDSCTNSKNDDKESTLSFLHKNPLSFCPYSYGRAGSNSTESRRNCKRFPRCGWGCFGDIL